jgi:hypothetical protein
MNTKYYLATILIFVAFFLSGFSSNAQNGSDTIRVVKKGLGYIYYKDNQMLNFKQAMHLTASNPEAFRLLEKSNSMRNAGYIFAAAGGGCVGYSLGYALGIAMFGNTMNKGLFFSTLGAGAVLIGIGIGFEVGANNKAKAGIDLFNNAIKQSSNTNLDLGFSPGGVMLRLNF